MAQGLALILLASCGELPPKVSTPANLHQEFLKICVEGSGKGRIEILKDKNTFSYESQFDRPKNNYDLALDFPLIGERDLSISLDPVIVNQRIKTAQLADFLKGQLSETKELPRVVKSLEEFFVFASEFMRARAANQLPKNYAIKFVDDHFILERETPSYLFTVDNFSANENYYERTVFKIRIKDFSTDPILTLFLVPETCEK